MLILKFEEKKKKSIVLCRLLTSEAFLCNVLTEPT